MPHHSIIILLFFFNLFYQYPASQEAIITLNTTFIDPVIISEDGEGACPSQERRDADKKWITNATNTAISNFIHERSKYRYIDECGSGLWYQVASLNLSDSSQLCPSAWREYNSEDGIRACCRPESAGGSCPNVIFSTDNYNQLYSHVCGRVIGYQYGSTDALGHYVTTTLDSTYIYGVSITHGMPRNHIWSYVAGLSERLVSSCINCNCPCADPSNPSNAVIPSFLGDNHYCESGNPTNTDITDHLYSADPLWDGEQCEGECCSNGKSPPWFSVDLSTPTTDDKEVRICNPQGTFDDVAIQLLEIYIDVVQ